MSLTTDKNDPELHEEGSDGRNKKYLVLSEEERAKGFVRPVRDTYRHVGKSIDMSKVEEISKEDMELAERWGYVGFIPNDDPERPELLGRYITEADLNSGCGQTTTMSRPIAETYARQPDYYSATFCSTCRKHLNVEEFVWEGTNERLGS